MRVAIDATALLDAPTGVGVFVSELLGGLAGEPTLDVVAYGLTARYRRELGRRLPANVAVARWAIPQRTSLRLWRRWDRPPIEWFTGGVAVVHGANFVVPPARRATELMTIHDLTPLHYPELCDHVTVHYPRYIRRALRRGAHVHTVSASVGEEVRDAFALPAERVHIVHNGLNPVTGGDPGRGRQLVGRDRYVLAVGTVEPRKNYPMLIEAFDAVAAGDDDVALVIAGRPGWRMEGFETALRSAAHRNRIIELGWVSDKERADLFAGALAVAYPSRYEGFGLPPLEAMSAGVPVVATAVGALPEVLGEAAVLVPPDRDALAEALGRVLTDSSLRADLVARGVERAARYSWGRCAREMAALYVGLAGE